jgi:hypothetical protein
MTQSGRATFSDETILMRLLRPVFLICLLTISLHNAACVSEGSIVEIEPGHRFAETILVRLVPFDSERRDPFDEGGFDLLIATGPYWTNVFTDNEDVQETFTIVDARLVGDGFGTVHYTYIVKGELTCGGQKYEINTKGSRSANFAVENARREAIQNAIVSTTDKIRQYLESCRADEQQSDKYQKLRELDSLRGEGILTEAEFEAEKRKILGQD